MRAKRKEYRVQSTEQSGKWKTENGKRKTENGKGKREKGCRYNTRRIWSRWAVLGVLPIGDIIR